MEKSLVLTTLALALLSTPVLAASSPMQVGRDKYEIEYGLFDSRRAVLAAANQFCHARGFAWMEEDFDFDGRMTFFCMRPGETISRPTSNDILVLPPWR